MHLNAHAISSRKPTLGPSLFILLAFAASPTSTSAQVFYNFVQSPSGDVLATLELSSLPATHSEVVGLTFTPAGDAIFGLGSSYTGVFTQSAGAFQDDLQNGLISSSSPNPAEFSDISPTIPQVSTNPSVSNPVVNFVLRAGAIVGQQDDGMVLVDSNINFFRADGSWIAVPEPASAFLSLTATAFVACAPRRKARRR